MPSVSWLHSGDFTGESLECPLEVAEVVVKATCILHNFLCWHFANEEDPSSTALCTELSAGTQGITQVAKQQSH